MNKERYLRQITLKGFGSAGQQKLKEAKVLVVGAGGLGVPVLTYLNAMGVGKIGIVDNDVVTLTNLHRQVLYAENDVGKSKALVAAQKLKAQNSDSELIVYNTYLTKENVLEFVRNFDFVVDATDNFPTRYLINDACVILNKPFIYGALHGYEGQVSVFNFEGGPTYRCLFPTMPKENELPNCNEHGVLGIIPGIIGNLQALEVVKLIAGLGTMLSGKLLIYNGLDQSCQKIKFYAKPENLKIKELQNFYEWYEPCTIYETVAAADLSKLLANNAQIVDVRSFKEYKAYHLEKTLHIPIDELESNLSMIDFQQPVYLLCQSGKRSERALNLLKKQHKGKGLFSILGGLNQYLAICS